MMKSFFRYFFLIIVNFPIVLLSQEVENPSILSYEEFIAFVKQHHPVLKQANLQLSLGEANLLKSRGGFDPKIEVDFNTKEFKDTEYYDLLSATFKIPTWYGIELKANFEENSGVFLNPENSVPEDGLYSAGIKVSALQGLLINDRMAALKRARFYLEQTKAERDLLVNDLLYEATVAYLDWVKADNEFLIYKNFLKNAEIRFKGIKRSVETGEKAAIDSVEAKITVQNRALGLEAARLKRIKSTLEVSNYLWLNGIPLELQPGVKPLLPENRIVANALQINNLDQQNILIENHPKIQSLNFKIESLDVDRRLKWNKLLPKLDLNYNFITESYDQINTLNTDEFKFGLRFSTPLFLRKERGDLQLAKFKLQDVNFERMATSLRIQNKINSAYAEIESLTKQNALINEMVLNYERMVTAEERKFSLGESSLFLVNSRETKLIDARLKQNEIQNKFLMTNAKLFNSLGLAPVE